MSEGEFFEGPSVVRDREHLFTEDLIVEETGVVDSKLPVLSKVSTLLQVLQPRGSSE